MRIQKGMFRKPDYRLATLIVLGEHDESAVLSLAASLALAAGHPLATALANRSDEPEIQLQSVDQYQTLTANGAAGWINGHAVVLGNSMLFAKLEITIGNLGDWAERLVQQGQSVTFIAVDGTAAGLFGVCSWNSLRSPNC